MRPSISKKNIPTRWTIQAWSDTHNIPQSTVKEKINKAQLRPGEDGMYSAADIFMAVSGRGDYEAARAREKDAKAELAELEVRKARRELYTEAEVLDIVRKPLAVVVQRIQSMPHVYASRCNPTQPEKAHAELTKAAANLLAPLPDLDKLNEDGDEETE
jgi:hypothetical protein